jgi:hypothetical protein
MAKDYLAGRASSVLAEELFSGEVNYPKLERRHHIKDDVFKELVEKVVIYIYTYVYLLLDFL